MNEWTEGSTPSTVPMKRKRGRPRKIYSIVQGTNMPVMPDSGVQRTNMPVMPDSGVQRTNMPVMPDSRVLRTNMPVMRGSSNKNSYQNVGTVDGCDDGMVGKKVACVIEGTFNGGYLLNVQVAADTYLRGVVFRPERVFPVTPASDVAPQVRMIERMEIPIPVLNPESKMHSSAPLPGQYSKQPFEAKLPVPMSVDPVLPAEVQSGISVSFENRSAPVVAPLVGLPKIDYSISTGEIRPNVMSKPRPEKTEILIPVLNPESKMRSSAPSPGQYNKQPFEAKLPVPMSVDPVIPAEVHSGISVSFENRSAPVVAPLVGLPKIDSSISAGEIWPKLMSKPRPEKTEILIPVLNPESKIHGSAPSSGQYNKQQLPVPMSVDPVLPAEVHSGIPVSFENQSALVVASLVDLPKIDSSISAGGIMPKTMSKPQPERIETLIPVLNPENQIHSSVPSPGQSNKQAFEAELPVPMTVDPVIPTKLHFGISFSLENQSAPVVEPLADLPKIDSSISAGGITARGMSKPGPESPRTSIMSEFEGDKTLKQNETLHHVDAPRQAKESNADGGATEDSHKTSEPMNLVPTVENAQKDFTTGQQSMPFVYNLNELIPDEPKHSTIEINQNPESAEHESIPSEHINNTVDNFVQMQGSLKTEPESQPGSSMSECEGDKTVEKEEKLHEVDVSRLAKESSADGGATKDYQQISETINLVPTVENTEKEELTTGQQSMPSAYKLNELIPDEPKRSITEKQVFPETDAEEDAKSRPVIETITKGGTANSNGTPSTDIANIPNEGPNHAVELSHPPILYNKEPVPSESKLLSEGSGFQEMSGPQKCSSSGAVKIVDGIQPTEVLATSSESENPIGSDAP